MKTLPTKAEKVYREANTLCNTLYAIEKCMQPESNYLTILMNDDYLIKCIKDLCSFYK